MTQSTEKLVKVTGNEHVDMYAAWLGKGIIGATDATGRGWQPNTSYPQYGQLMAKTIFQLQNKVAELEAKLAPSAPAKPRVVVVPDNWPYLAQRISDGTVLKVKGVDRTSGCLRWWVELKEGFGKWAYQGEYRLVLRATLRVPCKHCRGAKFLRITLGSESFADSVCHSCQGTGVAKPEPNGGW